MEKQEQTKYIRDYYSPLILNWLHKWRAIEHRNIDYFMEGFQYPLRKSWVLWKSRRTGKVIKKEYDYQITNNQNEL